MDEGSLCGVFGHAKSIDTIQLNRIGVVFFCFKIFPYLEMLWTLQIYVTLSQTN